MGTGEILIVHGGRFGQSEKIARAMRETLRERGLPSVLAPLTRNISLDPVAHAALLLVTSVRYGHFDRNAYRLLERNRSWLEAHPAQLVTVSLTARNPQKRDPQQHSYTKKFLVRSGWKGAVAVVAGSLLYPSYNLFDRLVIQFIMRITDGPTDPSLSIEYTDWEQVEEVAERFAETILGDGNGQ
ncbi:MAG: menaquinone-dependent protoporphyrinogen IX dehydrogenase [Propionibacteriaceae bacterium]|jgi:menaquinone-dependent protoporphyrinogen oxidase|nr:menaquinone-dependent protoporphyrinogen IX dehydrogenase [Propionibacteriaceae bacterium]